MITTRATNRLWITLAIAYGLGMILASGLIPEWGRWYSVSPHHRAQVEALLTGRLALSNDQAALRLDLVWAEDGVHQVWGLGVPFWRIPFEFVTRVLGARDFPGMFAFAVALGMTGWIVSRALLESCAPGPGQKEKSTSSTRYKTINYRRSWLFAGAVLLLLFFSPFINLLRSRFEIYEEVVAYEFLWGLLLIAGLVRLTTNATIVRFVTVCALAGFGGFIRPTLMLHGIGALVAAVVALVWCSDSGSIKQDRGRWLRVISVGPGLFGLGGGLLFVTNHLRFGNGFEFGHGLNLQLLYGSMYATRFDHPFENEPFLAAMKEMFGLLFLTSDFNGGDFYRNGIFPGQSSTLRWRELYISTYDLSFLIILLFGWISALRYGVRWRSWPGWIIETRIARDSRAESMMAVVGLYSLASSILLMAALLRNAVISSRYMLDFMPSIAAALLVGWLGWCNLWRDRRWGGVILVVSVITLVGWTVWEIKNRGSSYGPPRIRTLAEVIARQPSVVPQVNLPASGCYAFASEPVDTWIPYNGVGWHSSSGSVMPCVVLFVQDPKYLELDFLSRHPQAGSKGPIDLRAKVGLEFLERESVVRHAEGWRVRFRGPQNRRYRLGIQPVFLATVPNQQLADRSTPWRLIRVRWRQEEQGPGG
ncbi:MAG: hypothetical protein ABIF77_19070 [bacterium]